MHYHWPIVNISLPRKLPDLDGDQTSELVAACAVTLPSEMTDNHIHIRTSFILISGKKGKVMGQPVSLPNYLIVEKSVRTHKTYNFLFQNFILVSSRHVYRHWSN